MSLNFVIRYGICTYALVCRENILRYEEAFILVPRTHAVLRKALWSGRTDSGYENDEALC